MTVVASLAAHLPYSHMATETTAFLHEPMASNATPRHFALGRLWRIDPINIDAMSAERLVNLSKVLATPLAIMPKDGVLEISTTIAPLNRLDAWEQYRQERGINPATIPTGESFLRFVSDGMRHKPGNHPSRLRRVTTYIGYRHPFTLAPHIGASEKFKRLLLGRYDGATAYLSEVLEHHHHEQYAAFEELCAVIESVYAQNGFSPVAQGAEGILEAVSHRLSPSGNVPLYREGHPLRESMGTSEFTIAPSGYKAEGKTASVFSLRYMIGETWGGILSAVRRPSSRLEIQGADLWNFVQDTAITVVCHITTPPQTQLKALAEGGQKQAKQYGKGTAGEERRDIAAQKDQFELFADGLAEGRTGVRMGVHVISWQDPEKDFGRDRLLENAFKAIGGQLIQERRICNTLFPLLLPLGRSISYPSETSHVKRMQETFADIAMDIAPVCHSFTGFGQKRPIIPLLNRRGEPIYFDPFDAIKPHMLTFGATRGGKSFLTNWIIHNMVPLGATFFVVDRWGSYRDICDIDGGQHFPFEVEKPVCLGPFDGPLDPKHKELLVNVIKEMCSESEGPNPFALDYESSVVIQALLDDFADHRTYDRVPTLGEFVEYIKAHPDLNYADLCHRIITLLRPYYGRGSRAPFIDGPNELKLTPGLWSFDLSDLALTSTSLLKVVAASLMGRIDAFMRDKAHEWMPKYLIVDEAKRFFASPDFTAIVVRSLTEYARFKAGCWIITQQPDDLTGTMADAAFNNAGTIWAFPMSIQQASTLRKQYDLPMEFDHIIASQSKPPGCSVGTCIMPQRQDEHSGVAGQFVLVIDGELAERIGQSEAHKLARMAQEDEIVAREQQERDALIESGVLVDA